MENKYTKRMLDSFPKNFRFTDNKKDPLHIIVNSGAIMVSELERTKTRKVDNLNINNSNPAEPSGIYYIPLGDVDTSEIQINLDVESDASILEDKFYFLQNNITGFDFIGEVTPTGVFPSGILGVSYGFDWDEPAYYITPSGSDYIYEYSDFNEVPSLVNYSIKKQNYDSIGFDEYVNFVIEKAGDGVLPSGVFPDDIVKVAYLKNEPTESDIIIIDIGNLQDPNNSNSDGITVSDVDYTITGNRVVFTPNRSDYNPAIVTDIGVDDLKKYVYPFDYQPDKLFDSIFIVEYEYRVSGNPRYITQINASHNVGLKGGPEASL